MLLQLFRSKTVSALFQDEYLSQASLKRTTKSRYRSDMNRWKRYVGDTPINRIKEQDFQEFRNKALADGLEASSVESTVKLLKALVRYARDRGYISSIPLFGKTLKLRRPTPRSATLEELSKLYTIGAARAQYPYDRGVDPAVWWRAYLVVGFWTALRERDLGRGIAVEHFMHDRIEYCASKTSRPHIYPLSDVVSSHVAALRAEKGSLFRQMHPNPLRAELRRLCAYSGIGELTPKNIRQASINNWYVCSLAAGDLVQGNGIRVREHYQVPLQIMQRVCDQFVWPVGVK